MIMAAIIKKLINVSVIPGRSKQKNCELKCVAQSCSKLTDLFKKSRPDDQSSTNQNLDDVTGKDIQEETGEQK